MLSILINTALIILIVMTATWIVSLAVKEMSIVDVVWGLSFIIIALYHAFHLESLEPNQFLITYLVMLWGLRLAVYLFIRNRGKGEDPRYAAWRNDWGADTWWKSFFKVFMLQGVIQLIIALPILTTMAAPMQNIGIVQCFGVVLWTIGFFFESIADLQLFLFKRQSLNKGKVMQAGLWQYSRHPNYFGECLVWWGFFLISFSSAYWYVSILSPLLLTFLLLRVSGVTMLEARYQGNDAYSLYKQQTSPFFPLPPKKNI